MNNKRAEFISLIFFVKKYTTLYTIKFLKLCECNIPVKKKVKRFEWHLIFLNISDWHGTLKTKQKEVNQLSKLQTN